MSKLVKVPVLETRDGSIKDTWFDFSLVNQVQTIPSASYEVYVKERPHLRCINWQTITVAVCWGYTVAGGPLQLHIALPVEEVVALVNNSKENL